MYTKSYRSAEQIVKIVHLLSLIINDVFFMQTSVFFKMSTTALEQGCPSPFPLWSTTTLALS